MTRPESGFLSERYGIVRELGRGGAAIVFLARDQHLERQVAVKVLRQELAAALGRDRFLREVQFASHLKHPHIVPVLDFGETDGRLWYVMPYIGDGSLRQRLDRELQLRIRDTARWGAEVADALAFAHAQGVVHRDVKPENILIDGDHAWLADFGIARGLNALTHDSLTSAGIAIGTPAYMSPEQASASTGVDGRSDVYSLACVLYECLAGVPPFVGATSQSVIAQRFATVPHPVSSHRAQTPAAMAEAITLGLAVVPADRISAQAMAELLLSGGTDESPVPGRLGPRSASTRTDLVDAAAAPPAAAVSPAMPRARLRITALLPWAAGLLAVWLVVSQYVRAESPVLDPNKVVVYPLDAVGASGADEALPWAASVPSLIGSALDGLPPLRWVEGNGLVGESAARTTPEAKEARLAATMRMGARHLIEGTLLVAGDSLTVVMRLVDAERDSVVSRGTARGAGNASIVPSLALEAVGQLLPQLLDPGRRVDLRALTQRDPRAIASFTMGERDFRKSRYTAALAHYQAALAADSGLAIAAMKAARASHSLFDQEAAQRFVALALAEVALLPGANAPFARGLDYFYRRIADSALVEFNSAARLAPEWSEVHAALGDVHFYIGVDSVNADSAAQQHYQRATTWDSLFTPSLYHLALLSARRHDPEETRRFVRMYEQGESPDSTFMRAASVAATCQAEGVEAVNWSREATEASRALVMIGKVLVGSAVDLVCSRAAFEAVFAKPGEPSSDHFAAMIGLSAIAVIQEDQALQQHLIGSDMGRALRVRSLAVLGAVAGGDSLAGAEGARSMMADSSSLGPEEWWILGTWCARGGDGRMLERSIAALAQRSGASTTSATALMLASLRARQSLLRGDTTPAISVLAAHRERLRAPQVEWLLFHSGAADRLLLAQVYLQQGRYGRAIDAAARIEHPFALANAIFLRDSWRVRASAGRAVGNKPLVQAMERQLANSLRER